MLNEPEKITSRAVLSDSPHMILGFDILIELDNVWMIQIGKYAGLIEYFFLAGFVHPFDRHKIKSPFLAGLEDDGVLALCLLLIEMVIVHFKL